MPIKNFYSLKTASAVLGIGPRTLARWIDDTGITPIQIGRMHFLSHDHITQLQKIHEPLNNSLDAPVA